MPNRDAVESLLRQCLGEAAALRMGQFEAIAALANRGARVLLVQATGWGKSVVYFAAARLARESGPTLVVSPLISLMRNQAAFARRFGLKAEAMHSENREDWPEVEAAVRSGSLDVLLVSPERLHQQDFQDAILKRLLPRLQLLVIDEAHCISEWGHDFRPEYRSVLRKLEGLPKDAAILAATATATERVERDLRTVFGPFLDVHRGKLTRPSVRLVAVEMSHAAERLAWLAKYLPRFEGSGIVYTLTVFDAKEVARWLRRHGIDAHDYHAELDGSERIALETAFTENRLKALVATTALGMGYDKADVGFVVHYQTPSSLIAYYQQVGRAGRAIERAVAVLLAGEESEEIVESFVESARPPKWVFETIGGALRTGPKRFDELAHRIAVSGSMVRHALDILDAAGAAWRDDSGYYHGDLSSIDHEIRHGDEIRQLRRDEFQRMLAYVRSSRCRMQEVAEALGESEAPACGICDRCRPVKPFSLDPALIAEAAEYLQGEPKVLVPRVQLPLPVLDGRRQIPKELRNEPGIVLGSYGDEGWGKLVREGKYGKGRFAEALVAAAAQAVERLGSVPEWLAWIPSARRAALPEFAARLAQRLGIEAVEAIRRVAPAKPQKTMSTNEEQFWNVWSAFEVVAVRSGTCLLVDDIVDSGWTMSVAGLRLKIADSGPIVPLALAAASSTRIKFRDEVASP